jgi:membrane protein DedA with SNARE-associated domain
MGSGIMASADPPALWETSVEEFLKDWGQLGVFLGIIATGLGFPMPEELPVVLGGALVNQTNAKDPRWWLMLLACILGVLVGDSCLYLIGRFWGIKLVRLSFIKKHLLPPERLIKITHNFDKYGVKILLFARLTPGIRAPIFITAGITKLPWAKFFFADSIYAIPGVSLLFFLGYWFTDNMVDLIKVGESKARPIIIIVALLCVVLYFIYRHLRKPVVEGSPKEMPPVVSQVTSALDHSLVAVKEKIMHTGAEHKSGAGDPPAPAANGQATTESRSAALASAGPPRVKPTVKPITVAVVLLSLSGYFYFMYRLLRWRSAHSNPGESQPVADEVPKVLGPALANGQAAIEGDPIAHHPPEQPSR